MLYLIAAMSDDNVIGVDGHLPWRLKNELRWFRMNTSNGAVIMGRKTWDSLPRKPLPNRLNIIITRGPLPPAQPDIIWSNSLKDAIATAYRRTKRVYIIGGSDIFAMALQHRCRLLITRVHCTVNPMNNARVLLLPKRKTLIWRSETQCENDVNYHFELYIT